MAEGTYDGPVTYTDGWHWTVVSDEAGDHPGEKLYLDETTGAYRYAVDGDESWHDRFHLEFRRITVGGEEGIDVNEAEFEAIKEFLKKKRSEK